MIRITRRSRPPVPNFTVKFVLMPSGQVATMRCHLGQALGQLKGHFATELKIPADVILMLFDGKYTPLQLEYHFPLCSLKRPFCTNYSTIIFQVRICLTRRPSEILELVLTEQYS